MFLHCLVRALQGTHFSVEDLFWDYAAKQAEGWVKSAQEVVYQGKVRGQDATWQC